MDDRVEIGQNFMDALLWDASYGLTDEELRSIDRDVKSVIWANSVAQKVFPTKNLPQGKRQYRYYKFEEPSPPITSQDFMPEAMENLRKSEHNIDLLGFSKDYFISMVDIDASRNSQYVNQTIDTSTVREITAMVTDYWERFLWRGEDFQGPTRYYDDTSTNATADPASIIGGQTGIFNDANIQSADVSPGGDDDFKTAGDFPKAVAELAKLLLAEYFNPPYRLILTPGAYGRSIANQNATTNVSDLERLMSLTDKNEQKLLSGIHVTPHLGKGNDQMLLVAPKDPAGNPTVEIVQSYPIWHYPINANKLGIQGKVLVMGGAAVIRPNALAKHDAAMTV